MATEANTSGDKVNFLTEVPFEELFPKEAGERERLSGGPYHKDRTKDYIPIDEFSGTTVDMEAMIDAKRAPVPEEEEFEEPERGKYYYFRPKPHDLAPFHKIMAASENDDIGHPSFSSPISGRAHVKITYHRGGRVVRTKREAFT